MRISFAILAGVLSTGALVSFATAQTTAPRNDPETAYTGNVGDWGVGHWKGLAVRNTQGVGLTSVPFVLVIEKQQSSKVFCRFAPPEHADAAPWSSQCTITADSITLTTITNTSVRLTRTSQGGLEGVMRAAGGSSNVRFTRQ